MEYSNKTENLENEIWKKLPNTKFTYISNFGRAKKLAKIYLDKYLATLTIQIYYRSNKLFQ